MFLFSFSCCFVFLRKLCSFNWHRRSPILILYAACKIYDGYEINVLQTFVKCIDKWQFNEITHNWKRVQCIIQTTWQSLIELFRAQIFFSSFFSHFDLRLCLTRIRILHVKHSSFYRPCQIIFTNEMKSNKWDTIASAQKNEDKRRRKNNFQFSQSNWIWIVRWHSNKTKQNKTDQKKTQQTESHICTTLTVMSIDEFPICFGFFFFHAPSFDCSFLSFRFVHLSARSKYKKEKRTTVCDPKKLLVAVFFFVIRIDAQRPHNNDIWIDFVLVFFRSVFFPWW